MTCSALKTKDYKKKTAIFCQYQGILNTDEKISLHILISTDMKTFTVIEFFSPISPSSDTENY